MKTIEPFARLACLALLLAGLNLVAEETAIVKEGHVNVRGQPSLVGEVITQLQMGEKVTVLEEITLAKPKTNEPPKWARIQMPANTPVWVYGPYIDAGSKTVKVSRLNLRAGPGENYSVVGRLQRGASITEIRRVDDWVEIETPPGAYAFVAADLLTTQQGEKTALAPTPAPEAPKTEPAKPEATPPSAPESATATLPPPVAPPLANEPVEIAKSEPGPAVPAPADRTETALPPPAALAVPPPAASVPPVEAPAISPTATPQPGSSPSSDESRRRVVRREGLVRSTVSIQAPTYYELLSPGNRKTINYLHTDKLTVNLKDYRGRRIIVTGEEAIDPRWPKTPVIEVETLELIP